MQPPAAGTNNQRTPQLKLSWSQIEETYFRQPGKVQLLHQLADLHPFAGQMPIGGGSSKGDMKAGNSRAQNAEEGGIGCKRVGGSGQTQTDAFQVPNRPLRRGENLLELWDKSQARADRKQAKQSSSKKRKVELEPIVPPQKLSQWFSQISQHSDFRGFLESRFAYLDELDQDICADDNASTAGATVAITDSPVQGPIEAENQQRKQLYELCTMPQKRKRRGQQMQSSAQAVQAGQKPEVQKKTRNQKAVAAAMQIKSSISPVKQRKQLSGKANVDSLIKDLEKQLTGVSTEVVEGFNKLERKIQCYRKPKSQLIIEQKNSCAERHLEQLIIEFEMQQLAESVVQVNGRIPVTSNNSQKTTQQGIFNNRPFLLAEKLKHLGQAQSKAVSKGKQQAPVQISSRFPPSDPKWHYRIKFEASLGLDDLWVDSLTLDYLNSFRENIFVSQAFPISDSGAPQQDTPVVQEPKKKPKPASATRNQPKRKSKECTGAAASCNDTKSTAASLSQHRQEQKSDQQYGYCHQCKQLKKMSLLAECKYDSDKMGMQSPISTTVSDVSIFNVDFMNTSSLTHLVLRESEPSKAKPDHLQDLQQKAFHTLVPRLLKIDPAKQKHSNLRRHLQLSQKPTYRCNRKFCHACLKLCYDDDFNMCKNNRSWICHYCYGVCFCTRCLRQDVITQLKAYYMSMGGSLQSIARGPRSQLDSMIYSNFEMNLWLTLLCNPALITKFSTYRRCVGLSEIEDGAVNDRDEDQSAEASGESEDESAARGAAAATLAQKKSAKGAAANKQQTDKFSRLLEYAVLAQASEDAKQQLTLGELQASKLRKKERRRPNEAAILQAVSRGQPLLLTSRGRNAHLRNKKSMRNQDLNMIRSDGTKRKFFFRDTSLRLNLNKRQEKILRKALSSRSKESNRASTAR